MLVQLSSGQGPVECELAVTKLFHTLQREYDDITLISSHPSKTEGCYSSILFESESDLSHLEGTIKWVCPSPFRPHHKRKNWFVDVSIIPEQEMICTTPEIKFERFHCGGNGGQNVNKVETGVRLTHLPTGIIVTSTTERSQILNRKNALEKLNSILESKQLEYQKLHINQAWQAHNRIVRGNPVRTYEGPSFMRKK